jgi:hypothetical protein
MPGNNNWFGINLKKGLNNYEISFEACLSINKNLILDFEKASDYTAKLIAEQYENLHLSLSGGLDSEYIAMVLLRNNIPFTPVICYNSETKNEAWHARYFIEQHNLTPLIIDYKKNQNIFYSKLLRNARNMQMAPSIAFIPHIITEQINGSLITGSGDPFIISNDYDCPMGSIIEFDEHDYYLDVSFDKKHPGAFFSFTPDILFSLIRSLDISKNVQLAKSILYKIPGRSKIIIQLDQNKLEKLTTLSEKSKEKRCIIVDREKLLQDSITKNNIILTAGIIN